MDRREQQCDQGEQRGPCSVVPVRNDGNSKWDRGMEDGELRFDKYVGGIID